MMFTCDQFMEMLDSYIDGTLPEQDLQAMKEHAAGCNACREELAFAESVRSTLQSLPKLPVPDTFMENLNLRLDKEDAHMKKSAARLHRFASGWKKYSVAAACLLLAVVIHADPLNLAEQTNPSVPEIVVTNPVVDVPASKPNNHASIAEPADTTPALATPDKIVQNDTPAVSSKTAAPTAATAAAIQTAAPASVTASHEPVSEAPATTAEINHPDTDEDAAQPAAVSQAPDSSEQAPASTGEIEQRASRTIQNSQPEYLDDPSNVRIASPQDIPDTVSAVNENENPSEEASEHPITKGIKDFEQYGLSVANAANTFLFVESIDEGDVKAILDKYLSASQGTDYYLSADRYQQFIDELEENGIDYRSTDIFSEKAPVVVKLIIT